MMLSGIAEHLGTPLCGEDCEYTRVSTDSRAIVVGDLFIALRGDTFNGHDFVSNAVALGACGVVVDSFQENLNVAQLVVKDTTRALGQIAKLNRSHFKGEVIALTGSSGKTSVKNMLAEICELEGNTIATAGNFNNHIGVPLTLMKLHDQKYAIVEAGTSGVGEIEYLTQLIEPQIAVVSNVMAAHVEGFGSVAAIAEEKSQIYASSQLRVGVVNLDDAYLNVFLSKLVDKRIIGFAVENDTNAGISSAEGKVDQLIAAEHVVMQQTGCCNFILVAADRKLPVSLQVPGRHSVSNALAAAATAFALQIPLESIVTGLNKFTGTPGRMQMVASKYCKRLINDSYNANPGSMIAAIDYLAELGHGVLVMGDMGELGDQAVELHKLVARHARESKLESLYATGDLARYAVSEFGESGFWFENKSALISALHATNLLDKNILVKGSRFTRMEEVVSQLENNNEVLKC